MMGKYVQAEIDNCSLFSYVHMHLLAIQKRFKAEIRF